MWNHCCVSNKWLYILQLLKKNYASMTMLYIIGKIKKLWSAFDKQKKFWKPTALFKETVSIYDITVCGQQKRKLLTYGLTSITYHKDETKSTTCKSPVKPLARSMFQIQCKNMMGMSIVSKVKNLQSVSKSIFFDLILKISGSIL